MTRASSPTREGAPGKFGLGIVNDLINNLPVELHIPGYQFCGPGTRLKQRLARGQQGVNPLDAACREHDIAYSQNRDDISARHTADHILQKKAWERTFAPDSSLGEKAAALAVANIMKAKQRFGLGMKVKKKRKVGKRTRAEPRTRARASKKRVGKGLPRPGKRKRKSRAVAKKKTTLQSIARQVKRGLHPQGEMGQVIRNAILAAKSAVERAGGKSQISKGPRILPLPKVGGLLPAFLVPLFAALSAAGSLTGGAAAVARAVSSAKEARAKLDEDKRHNQAMESAIALGRGLFIKPYRRGLGLYVKSHPKKGRGLFAKAYPKKGKGLYAKAYPKQGKGLYAKAYPKKGKGLFIRPYSGKNDDSPYPNEP